MNGFRLDRRNAALRGDVHDFELPPGEYALTAWRTKWPKGMFEEQFRKRTGKAEARRMKWVGTAMGVSVLQFGRGTLVAAGLSFVAVLAILLRKGRTGLGISPLLWSSSGSGPSDGRLCG